MSVQFDGFRHLVLGVVLKVGWNRAKGYGAKVVYEYGYVEIVPVAKLVELQKNTASKNMLEWFMSFVFQACTCWF